MYFVTCAFAEIGATVLICGTCKLLTLTSPAAQWYSISLPAGNRRNIDIVDRTREVSGVGVVSSEIYADFGIASKPEFS